MVGMRTFTGGYGERRARGADAPRSQMLARGVVGLALLAGLAGCATPIGVNRVGMDRAYAQLTANALNGPQLSAATRMVLARYGLEQLHERTPDVALAQLHEHACRETRRDVLFALAETSYAAGEQYAGVTWATVRWMGEPRRVAGPQAARTYHFAAAVYAWLYLFGEGRDALPDPFDPRFRLACDLYNRGLAKALKQPAGDTVDLEGRALPLPMGKINITTNRAGFPWSAAQFHEFVAADEYTTRGLTPRLREPGLGVPLIALPDRAAFGERWPAYYPPGLKVPATALLRLQGTVGDMTGGGLKATLELYSGYDAHELTIAGRTVRLESDVTAAIAYSLEHSIQWKARMAQFFSGEEMIRSGVYLPQPYERGKIPLVLVHGTAGSSSDWAATFNLLRADPVIRARYQIWAFAYNTGNPIAYSGALLREGLDRLVRELDPDGTDAALHQMLIAGHSQGGLVTKLAVVRSGDRFTRMISDEPLDTWKLPEADRQLLRRALVVEPLPYVRRVIFVSTPHRGSILVSGFIQSLGQRLIKTPAQLTQLGTKLATLNLTAGQSAQMKQLRGKVPTSVANMKPDNPFLNALHDLPLADGVVGHSIIAVKPGLDVPTGNDGVVAYTSAHLDGMGSEFVVRDSHTCQGNPVVVEEIRRILLLHLE